MESKIIRQNKNPFLQRQEFLIELKSESNLTLDDIKEAIAKDKELTTVKKINSNFGRTTFTAEAVVYDSKEAKEKIEKIPKAQRKKLEGKEGKPVEQPAKENTAQKESEAKEKNKSEEKE